MVEVCLALVISAGFVLVSATGFSASLTAAGRAERLTDGALFLQTSMESIGAQPYEDLLALDGNVLFDGQTLAQSNFTVRLSVFQAQANLIQVSAFLMDRRTGLELGRISTLRAQR